MTFALFMVWSNLCPVAVAILADCCMAFANMQLSELCHGPLVLYYFYLNLQKENNKKTKQKKSKTVYE